MTQSTEPKNTREAGSRTKPVWNIGLATGIITILKSTLLIAIAIICTGMLYAVVLITISPTFRSDVAYAVGLAELSRSLEPDPPLYKISYPNPDDLIVVRHDHDAISGWVQDCVGGVTSWIPISELMFPSELSAADTVQHLGRPLLHSEKALIQLSASLSEERLALIAKVRSSYSWWERTTLFSILVGMITTTLVSISSTEFGHGKRRYKPLIRILAIIFPALGTATTAVVGFYSPQAAWGQASRTLASETQLHDEIALAVWNIKCPDANNTAELIDSLQDWSKRYTDIQTISNASGIPTGSKGSGNQPSGSQGSGNSPGRTSPGAAPAAATPSGRNGTRTAEMH